MRVSLKFLVDDSKISNLLGSGVYKKISSERSDPKDIYMQNIKRIDYKMDYSENNIFDFPKQVIRYTFPNGGTYRICMFSDKDCSTQTIEYDLTNYTTKKTDKIKDKYGVDTGASETIYQRNTPSDDEPYFIYVLSHQVTMIDVVNLFDQRDPSPSYIKKIQEDEFVPTTDF